MRNLGVVVSVLLASSLAVRASEPPTFKSPREAVRANYDQASKADPFGQRGSAFLAVLWGYHILDEEIIGDTAIVRVAERLAYAEGCDWASRFYGERRTPTVREWKLSRTKEGWGIQPGFAAYRFAPPAANYWLDREWWLVVSGSFRRRADAEAFAKTMWKAIEPPVMEGWKFWSEGEGIEVVRSDDFPMLRPGYWIVVHTAGYCFSRGEARAVAQTLTKAGMESYIRRVH